MANGTVFGSQQNALDRLNDGGLFCENFSAELVELKKLLHKHFSKKERSAELGQSHEDLCAMILDCAAL